jgi:hypothetical protein
MGLQFFNSLRRKFDFVVDVSVCDASSANLLAEKALQHLFFVGVPRLRMRCHIHRLHTITGKCFDLFDSSISGIIALGLSMKGGGSASRFRQCIATILEESAILAPNGCPPSPTSSARKFRTMLFDLCLPSTTNADRQRRFKLEYLFTGDIRSDAIEVFIPAEEYTNKTWAREAAQALFPAALQVFPRGRWCSSLHIISSVCLLAGVHGVLHKAATLWLKPHVDTVVSCRRLVVAAGGSQPVPDQNTPSEGPTANYWKEFNAKQRTTAFAFTSTYELDNLLIMRVAVEPMAAFLRYLFHVRSPAWEQNQKARVVAGENRTFRITEAWAGRLSAALFDDLAKLMFEEPPWLILAPSSRISRNLSLAFAALCREGGGVFHLFQRDHRSYPCKLFGLLVHRSRAAHAQQIITDPACLKDSLTLALLRKYGTSESLCSQPCIAVLTCLAVLLELDTADVECRHAWIRRHMVAKSATWSQHIPATCDSTALRPVLAQNRLGKPKSEQQYL